MFWLTLKLNSWKGFQDVIIPAILLCLRHGSEVGEELDSDEDDSEGDHQDDQGEQHGQQQHRH